MTDQTTRLEIATVNAEIGSNVVYRFANDPVEAAGIPTSSGDIQNLKQVIVSIENKASISTSIYPDVATGLAAVAEGAIFLVQSADATEIYAVWTKTSGVAVDTGKRALSSQAVEDAITAAKTSETNVEALVVTATAQSGNAAQYASDAATQATLASVSAAAAASLAAIQSGIYATEPLGRAAVADGASFLVQGDGVTTSILVYRRTNSATSVSLGSVPNSSLVTQLSRADFTTNSNFKMQVLAPDSGYAWALMDKNNHAAILVGLDGTVTLPKYARDAYIANYLNPDTGYVWAVMDANKRIALGITNTGKLVGSGINDIAIPGTEYLVPTKTIWHIGDSLTQGASALAGATAAAYPNRTVVDSGIGGQTSTQIAARVGAYNSLLNVVGNSIPASGLVTVASMSIQILSSPTFSSGSWTLNGWLAGIYGTLTCTNDPSNIDANDIYTFTRSVAGSVTYCPPNAPFVPDVAGADFGTLIIFVGRNNVGDSATIQADIDALVGLCKTAKKQFLILTPPNGGTLTAGQVTNEGTGSSTLISIKAVEAWATKKYGDRVIKPREFLMQHGDGSADDLSDIANETVPRSLRKDAVHWNLTGNNLVDGYIVSELNRRGW